MSGLESSRAIKFYPWLAKRTTVNAAIIAQQIYYWQCQRGGGRIHEGQRWVYNTYEQWAEQTGLTPQQVKDAIKLLEDAGALASEQLDKSKYSRVKFYRIDASHPFFDDPGEAEIDPDEIESSGVEDADEQVYRPGREGPQTRSSLKVTKTTTETNKHKSADALTPLYMDLIGQIKIHCSQKGIAAPTNPLVTSLQVLEQIPRLDLIQHEQLPKLLAWALQDDFWGGKNLLLSIPQWRKRGGNGLTKIANAYQDWQKAQNGRGNGKPAAPALPPAPEGKLTWEQLDGYRKQIGDPYWLPRNSSDLPDGRRE